MSIVYQHDKRSGITYAYESKSYWDKEKRQSRAKRTLIGRVDNATGKIVPTDGRVKNAKSKANKPDYKELYEQLSARFNAQEKEVEALREQLAKLRS
jgi:uncharacterized protein YceH (UPF0502 family)